MCYNFATFVLYLDVITLIYRENRLTSSETSLSAKISVTCCFTTRYADFSLYTSDELRTILDNMSDEHL